MKQNWKTTKKIQNSIKITEKKKTQSRSTIIQKKSNFLWNLQNCQNQKFRFRFRNFSRKYFRRWFRNWFQLLQRRWKVEDGTSWNDYQRTCLSDRCHSIRPEDRIQFSLRAFILFMLRVVQKNHISFFYLFVSNFMIVVKKFFILLSHSSHHIDCFCHIFVSSFQLPCAHD